MLDISKSALSKHLSALADAGYVEQRRAVRDTRQRLWLSLTPGRPLRLPGPRRRPPPHRRPRRRVAPPRPTPVRVLYPVLQETVGHVHWPLGEIVTPQLLPLPLGVAFSTYWLG